LIFSDSSSEVALEVALEEELEGESDEESGIVVASVTIEVVGVAGVVRLADGD
jgi:hypothetical protein